MLRELDKKGRTTSKDLAHRLGRPVKEISNDLGRLKQMGFAKADREKRPCSLGQWGDVCNRGYQYVYYVSDQGKSYLNFIDNIEPKEDSEHRELVNLIAECLPSDLKRAVLAYFLSKPVHKYKDPSRRSQLLTEIALTSPVLSIAPSTLELENQRLAEENRKLAEENRKLVSESENALTESSRDYECKIKEMEQKHITREQELNKESELLHTTIDTLSRRQNILESVYRELVKIHVDSLDFPLATLRKYAPTKEYVTTLELMIDFERTGVNSIIARALIADVPELRQLES